MDEITEWDENYNEIIMKIQIVFYFFASCGYPHPNIIYSILISCQILIMLAKQGRKTFNKYKTGKYS